MSLFLDSALLTIIFAGCFILIGTKNEVLHSLKPIDQLKTILRGATITGKILLVLKGVIQPLLIGCFGGFITVTAMSLDNPIVELLNPLFIKVGVPVLIGYRGWKNIIPSVISVLQSLLNKQEVGEINNAQSVENDTQSER